MDKQFGKWRVYHMVQPYFLAHHHLHRRKLETLRTAGIPAWGLSFVPEELYQTHRSRYDEVTKNGVMKIIRIPGERDADRAALFFFAKEAVLHKGILVHILRTDPAPVIHLRRWPAIGNKVRYVLEYEGDMPLELIYQEAYVEYPRPPSDPPLNLRKAYETLLSIQSEHVRQADGLVLMSPEHVHLWETRLGRAIDACWLPTLADPARIKFSQAARDNIRKRLGIHDRHVLVYTGNVICKWQRLNEMCRFVSDIAKKLPSVWFLAIVRLDDLELAREAVKQYGLSDRSTVIHTRSDEVGDYLSAADAAVFLRHHHPMNTVVTSGKLGEYMAAGLPILTTGANSKLLNDFLRETEGGIFVHDSLRVDDCLMANFKELLDRTSTTEWKSWFSQQTADRFGGRNDPFLQYVPFIKKIISRG